MLPAAASPGPRQRVGLGVRGAGAPVPALGRRRVPSAVDEHAADPGVGVGLAGRGAPARGHGASSRVLLGRRSAAVAGAMSCPRARRRSVELRGTAGGRVRPAARDVVASRDAPGPAVACCLPSGLSPSVREFHPVNRPLAAVGSRTVTAGSELHRPRSTSPSSMPAVRTAACAASGVTVLTSHRFPTSCPARSAEPVETRGFRWPARQERRGPPSAERGAISAGGGRRARAARRRPAAASCAP